MLFMLYIYKYLDVTVKYKLVINPWEQGPNLIIFGILAMLGTWTFY